MGALSSSDPAEKTMKLAAAFAKGRLAVNGHLAILAIIGMFIQDGLNGSAWGDRALYAALPPRAFENRLGAQAPGRRLASGARLASPLRAAPRTPPAAARR